MLSVEPRLCCLRRRAPGCYDKKMVLRSAVSFLLLAACTAALSQTPVSQAPVQSAPTGPRIFHNPALGVTIFYPERFTAVQLAPAKVETGQSCAHSMLSGSSVTPVGKSAFVFSSVGSACPAILQAAATNLDDFTRRQLLRQLKQYGDPVVTHDPMRYTIDGHPASITIASVKLPADADVNSLAIQRKTYAAKACVLGEVPDRHNKASVASQTKQIVCFDFTTEQNDLMPLMLAFTMQFGGDGPQPVVPRGVLH